MRNTSGHDLCTVVHTLWSTVTAHHLAPPKIKPSLVLLPAYFSFLFDPAFLIKITLDSSFQLPTPKQLCFLRYHVRSSLVLLVAYFMISRDNLAALQVLPSLLLLLAHFMVSPAAMPYPYCVSRQPADGNTIQWGLSRTLFSHLMSVGWHLIGGL